MTRRPDPLPDPLPGTAFSVADAAALGVSDRRMRASDLLAPFHGVRAPAGPLTVLDRCRARATRLPAHAAISHTTAAQLDALPLPLRLSRDDTVHVSVPLGSRAPSGRGTRGHQVAQRPGDANRRHGVLSTTPARTFCDLAALLSLAELVAVGDVILRAGLATHAGLVDAVNHHAARRGRTRLVRALTLIDARAESPKESELRVLLIERGFTVPQINHEVRDAAGRFVARIDLAYPELKIAIEYDGDHHRDRAQWRRDVTRRRRLEALGWTYLTVTQADLDDPTPFLTDLRTAITPT